MDSIILLQKPVDRNKWTRAFICLFITGLLSMPFNAMAQFSETPDEFVEQFAKYLKDSRREESRQAASEFIRQYETGALTPEMVLRLRPPVNDMLAKKMSVNPYFTQLTQSVNAICIKGNQDRFDDYMEMVSATLYSSRSASNKKFKQLLAFSSGFFDENRLYSSKNRNWEVDALSWELKMEDDKPAVFFPLVKLIGFTKGDTILIKKARGTYYPVKNIFKGNMGTVDWGRTKLDGSNVYAEFGDFRLVLNESGYQADSARFYYKPYLTKPVIGRLTDKMVINNTADKSTYPRFDSYTKEFVELQLFEGVIYEGGFTIKGSQFIGFGEEGHRAMVNFFEPSGRLAARAWSGHFLVGQNRTVNAASAEVQLYIGMDTITHPGVKLRYQIDDHLMLLSREERGVNSSPFYSSWHQIEATIGRITWVLGDSILQLGPLPGSIRQDGFLSSINIYQDDIFHKVQGVTSYHPLVVLYRYAENRNTRELSATDFAVAMNPSLTVQGVQGLLFDLMRMGFVYYDKENEWITIQDKTINYVLANAGQIDYDVIRMKSTAKDKVNAVLDTRTQSMKVNGVYQVTLSDSTYVRAFPKDKQLTMEGNRDFVFDGTVFGGSSDFYGREFKFEYDSFLIRLPNIDSMVLYTPTGEKLDNGAAQYGAIKTSITSFKGTLLIDQPQNKSGLEDYGIYPLFLSTGTSVAHYEKASIYDSAYAKDRFFFEVEPFELDSMDIYDPSSVRFRGKLNSGGIFPDLDQELQVMQDRSLGFETSTPDDGLPLYDGKGRFTGDLSLSNSGFIGSGRIDYLTTGMQSDKVIFFPDSAKGLTDEIVVNEQRGAVPFPQVGVHQAFMNWQSTSDSLMLFSRDQPFAFFDSLTHLEGNIVITPRGMRGSGTMDWTDALIHARDFKFGAKSMSSDSAVFAIKSAEANVFAFKLPDANAHIDFESGTGLFKSNDRSSWTDLPYNRYQTQMNEFAWDMDSRTIRFKPPSDREFSQFRSIHPGQDSLHFQARGGLYNMNSNQLKIDGVPYIAVADAWIYPDSGLVTVEADARIPALENARIVFDSLYGFHELTAARINILSSHELRGSGNYAYTDRTGTEQNIFFNKIYTQEEIEPEALYSSWVTHAEGSIPDSIPFYLDPKVLYKGPVAISSNSDKVSFSGYAKLNITDTANFTTGWFRINDAIESEDFRINIDTAISERKDTVYVGLFKRNDGTQIYPSILDRRHNRRDRELLRVKGVALFDPDHNEFAFGPEDKIEEFTQRGSVMRFNDGTGEIYADGAIDLGVDYGLCNVKTAGTTVHKLQDTAWVFDMTLALNLILTDEIREQFANDLYEYNLDAEWIDYEEGSVFLKNLPQFFNEKDEQLVLDGIYSSGEFYRPKDFDFDLMFTDLELMWDEASESFRTVRDTAGLVYVGDISVNQQIRIWAEFGLRRSSDYFNIYLETSYDQWYFLSYRKNVLKLISSDEGFNDMIINTDPKKATFQHPDGNFSVLTFGMIAERNRFLQKIGYYD